MNGDMEQAAAELRQAIEGDLFSDAEQALERYCAAFAAGPATAESAQSGLKVISAALECCRTRKAHIADRLLRASAGATGYARAQVQTTWQLEG